MAETQVYQENNYIDVEALLYIGLRLFLTQKCLSPINSEVIFIIFKGKFIFSLPKFLRQLPKCN